jgi:hypothetical protein
MEYSGYLSEELGLQASSIQEAIEFIRDGGTAELEHVLELARAVEDGDVESAQLALEYVNKYRRKIFDEGLYHFPKQKSIQDYVETFIQEVKDLLDEREGKWVESRKDPWKELAKEFGIRKIGEATFTQYPGGKYTSDPEKIKQLFQQEKVEGTLDLSGESVKDLGNIRIVDGDLIIPKSGIKSLGNLERVEGSLYAVETGIVDLGNLKFVGEDLGLTGSSAIESLGKLKSVGGDLLANYTNLKDLGELRFVDGDMNIFGSDVQTLGNLQRIGGSLFASGCFIKDLGQLRYVGENLNLEDTRISNLGNLEYVGGNLDLRRTPISKMSEQERESILKDVIVKGEIKII